MEDLDGSRKETSVGCTRSHKLRFLRSVDAEVHQGLRLAGWLHLPGRRRSDPLVRILSDAIGATGTPHVAAAAYREMSDPASQHAFPGVSTPPRTPSSVRGVGLPIFSRVRRWFALSPVEQITLVLILMLVAVVRATLWLMPSSASLKLVRRIAAGDSERALTHRPPLERLTWAVEAASRRIPHASCLTQAVSAQLLLRHFGYASQLCLGVARSADGVFAAHAWVESCGRIIIGGQNSAGFTPLYAPRAVAHGEARTESR